MAPLTISDATSMLMDMDFIFQANVDVVAPAGLDSEFKKELIAGCHSRLDR